MSRLATISIFCVVISIAGLAQTSNAPADARGVLRLRVRVKVGEATRGLSRKRFFLIKGSTEQNRTLIESVAHQTFVSRDCYYRRAGASEQLISWLRQSDCDSIYCREIAAADFDGPAAVPEFRVALGAGEKEFGSRELARKWIAVNVPDNIRDGFYRARKQQFENFLKQAEAASGAKVISVMTDRNGTAYFTDLEPGAYWISNLLPVEVGSTSVTWDCAVQVKPGDLATEKPYLISNRSDRNVKCVGLEKPLPVCDSGRP